MIKKIICIILLNISIFLSHSIPISAAKGYEGYAIYRDGVSLGFATDWHAGIMDEPSTDYYKPVTHATKSNVIKWDTWANFLAKNTFKGVYTPKGTITSAKRSLVKATGRKLISQDIPYTFLGQIDYPIFQMGTRVHPDEIGTMRCDGVVEYTYEYNGIAVYSTDISWGSASNLANHAALNITPLLQTGYMTKVLATKPVGYK